MKNKTVLITLWYAHGFHGGVMYIYEISRYFKSLGYDVYLAGMIWTGSIKQMFKDIGVRFYDVSNVPVDTEYDLVWACHFPIVPYLIIRGLRYKRIINSSMSEFLPIEKPLFFKENLDIVLTLTDNAKSELMTEYGFGNNLIISFPNMAPDEWFDVQKKLPNIPKNIAIVSNHPPKELTDAIKILKTRGVKCTLYGSENNNSVRITPKLLSKYDAVVSIGKTVQYSLAAGIPIYTYDQFGGSGYITPENIDIEQTHNFSGRSFRTKKTSKQIADELIGEYEMVAARVSKLRTIADTRYKLSNKMSGLLETLDSLPAKPFVEITAENRLSFEYCRAFCFEIMKHRPKQKSRKLLVKLAAIFIPSGKRRREFRKKYL